MGIHDLLSAVTARPLPAAACALVLLVLGLLIRLVQAKAAASPSPSKNSNKPSDKYPWLLQFPPSRRHTLAELKLKGSTGPYTTPAPEVLSRLAIPSTATPDFDKDNQFTPTGFSTQDLRALGRFPDYSVITGTRYPKPYGSHFDIKKAIFRPFRPFRWNYHQTMGKSRLSPHAIRTYLRTRTQTDDATHEISILQV